MQTLYCALSNVFGLSSVISYEVAHLEDFSAKKELVINTCSCFSRREALVQAYLYEKWESISRVCYELELRSLPYVVSTKYSNNSNKQSENRHHFLFVSIVFLCVSVCKRIACIMRKS